MVEVYLHGGHIGGESLHNLFLLMTVFEMKRIFRDITTRPSVHPCLFCTFGALFTCCICLRALFLPCFTAGYQSIDIDACGQIVMKLNMNCMRLTNFSIPKFSRPPGSTQYQIREKFMKLH
jgi:hypothetical protein